MIQFDSLQTFEEPFSQLEYVRTSGLGGNKLADSSERDQRTCLVETGAC